MSGSFFAFSLGQVIFRFENASMKIVSQRSKSPIPYAGGDNISRVLDHGSGFGAKSSRALLAECLKHNEVDAWREFVRRFQPVIAGAIWWIVRTTKNYCSGLVQQLTQDTFVKLCDDSCIRLRSVTLADDKALAAYLRVVARRLALDYCRNPANNINFDDPEAVDRFQMKRSSRGLLPSQRNVLLGEIDCFLNRITRGRTAKRDRLVFWLYHRQGFTAQEIALLPAVNLTTKGVESLLRRTLIALQSEMALKSPLVVPAQV